MLCVVVVVVVGGGVIVAVCSCCCCCCCSLCITIALSVLLLCHVETKPLALMRARDQDYTRCRRSIEEVQTECMNTKGTGSITWNMKFQNIFGIC